MSTSYEMRALQLLAELEFDKTSEQRLRRVLHYFYEIAREQQETNSPPECPGNRRSR